MSLFVGALALEPRRDVTQRERDAMAQHLSRHPGGRATRHAAPGFAAAFVDVHGRGDETVHMLNGRWSLLAGDPMLPPLAGDPHKAVVQLLHDDWLAGDDRTLAAERGGAFCLAQVDAAGRRLRLVADKLALRPLYYGVHEGVAYFATALRMMLQVCPALGEQADIAGQAQYAVFDFALGDHTPYAAIRVVEPGQIVDIDASGIRRSNYWSWDTVGEQAVDEAAFSRRLHAAFGEAVAVRSVGEAEPVSFLSGGLDSRCLVAALRMAGKPVHTINYAPAGSADLVLGRLAAEALQTHHFEASNGFPDYFSDCRVEAYDQWRQGPGCPRPQHKRARIWAGFGGEALLAPTDITEPMLAAMRAGKLDEAIDHYLSRAGAGLHRRLFRERWRQRLTDALRASLRREIERHTCRDPARRFHLYLLLNLCRGGLVGHFENLDLRPLDFVLPFYDTALVRLVLGYPLDELLRHRFYYRWLQEFQPEVANVPWQAYPWSLPCPLPIPPGLRDQWRDGWYSLDQRKAALRRLLDQVRADLADPRFPSALIDRSVVIAAYVLGRLGIGRYDYLLRSARVFVRHAAANY